MEVVSATIPESPAAKSTPITSLPTEILQLIFECLPSYTLTGPLPLSCSRFREVVITSRGWFEKLTFPVETGHGAHARKLESVIFSSQFSLDRLQHIHGYYTSAEMHYTKDKKIPFLSSKDDVLLRMIFRRLKRGHLRTFSLPGLASIDLETTELLLRTQPSLEYLSLNLEDSKNSWYEPVAIKLFDPKEVSKSLVGLKRLEYTLNHRTDIHTFNYGLLAAILDVCKDGVEQLDIALDTRSPLRTMLERGKTSAFDSKVVGPHFSKLVFRKFLMLSGTTFSQLKDITVRGVPRLNQFFKMWDPCPFNLGQLTSIYLERCAEIGEMFQELASELKSLMTLKLVQTCHWESASKIAASLPNLRDLYLILALNSGQHRSYKEGDTWAPQPNLRRLWIEYSAGEQEGYLGEATMQGGRGLMDNLEEVAFSCFSLNTVEVPHLPGARLVRILHYEIQDAPEILYNSIINWIPEMQFACGVDRKKEKPKLRAVMAGKKHYMREGLPPSEVGWPMERMRQDFVRLRCFLVDYEWDECDPVEESSWIPSVEEVDLSDVKRLYPEFEMLDFDVHERYW